MSKKKQDFIAPPSATGGEGYYFENHVQASFVALMFSKGFAPLFPEYQIDKVMLQANVCGYETDDAVVFLKKDLQERKLLCQIKLTIRITPGNSAFKSCISDAWKDFNNPRVYDREKDEFLVITSNLCSEDVAAVKLLQEIRSANSSEEFFTRLNTSRATSKEKRKKIEALKALLQIAATDGNDCSVYPGDDVFFEFYKHIYILNYDVIEKESVVLSLLYSHLNQVCAHQSQKIWYAIRAFVGNKNIHAGTINLENIRAFLQEDDSINQDFFSDVNVVVKKIKACNPKVWLCALLIGGWDNSCESDKKIIEKISGISYDVFFEEIRRIENSCSEAFKVNQNYWSIKNRKSLWPIFSDKFIDDDLKRIEELFLMVLKEIHPRYAMPVDERYMARLLGKDFVYSYNLRKNISETLAILTSVDSSYNKCSSGTNENIVNRITRKLLNKASLDLLGSLDDVLPILSEASPNEFISAIDSSFDSVVALYSQNINPMWGPYDNVGLSKSFEILAHSENYFPRVIDCLAEIIQHVSNDVSDNVAFRTLCDILQPYHKLIAVPEEIQDNAIANMFKKEPDVAWKFSMETLGSRPQIVATISEPQWRNWPKTDQTQQKKFEFVRKRLLQNQAEMLSLAKRENFRVPELIDKVSFLAENIRQELYVFLQNMDLSTLDVPLRYSIWQKLRHECDFGNGIKSEIKKIRDYFAPTDSFVKNQQYFSDDFYSHMFVGKHKYDEIEKQKESDRQRALYELYTAGGANLILEFCEKIENSYAAGFLFYRINSNADSLFPKQLNTISEKRKDFLSGYISAKLSNDDKWLSTLDVSNWNEHEKKEFLLLAPFKRNVWEIVPRWLQDEAEYWSFVNLRHWQEENLTEAIKKFLKCKRPKAALYCLFTELQREKRIDNDDCIQSLIDSVSSNEPQNYHYESKELIQYLQQQENVDESKMFGVECAYSPMLESEHDMQPRFINKAICDTPENFAALVRYSYRAKSDIGKELKLTKEQQNAATNSHRILKIWNMIPGMNNGIFDFDTFMLWLDKVKELCLADERLEIALEIVGKKMIYTPADANGLWIDCRIAKLLDSRDGELLRSGFHSEEINSKGAYTSNECAKFSAEYESKAKSLRDAGYTRFAETLDDLAEMYRKENERLSW